MIYDCFTFFNEIELLELRFNILDPVVDFFVISEGDRTFRGKKKPSYIQDNYERFAKWSEKIIHLEAPLRSGVSPWTNEALQRNYISEGLASASEEDIVFISDVDEIWNADILEDIISAISSGPVKLKQNIYYYYLNLLLELPWHGTVALLKKDLTTPERARRMGASPSLENGGWHFSYLGSPELIQQKIKAFSHSELDAAKYNELSVIQDRIRNGQDLFGRKIPMRAVEIDSCYPIYIRDNLESLKHLIVEKV